MLSNDNSLFFYSSPFTEAISKRSEVITGRGFAAPPEVKITENYNSPSFPSQSPNNQNIYQNSVNSYQGSKKYFNLGHYQYQNNNGYNTYDEPNYQSYLPKSDYQKLKQKLTTNDQLRSYIHTLKQQINQYTGSERQDLYDYRRNTAVDLNQYYDDIPTK